MRPSVPALCGCMLLIAVPSGLKASKAMTWNDCVLLAREGNAGLKSAREKMSAAIDGKWGAWSGFLPQISAGVGYSYDKYDTTPAGAKNSDATKNYTASVTASQNLFAGMADWAKVLEKRAEHEKAVAAFDAAKAKASYVLKAVFEGARYSQQLESLADTIVQRRESNLALVELRFESGRENKGALLLSKAYLGQARLEKLQARNAARIAKGQLAAAVGEGADEIEAVGRVPVIEPRTEDPDFAALAPLTPDHREAAAAEDAASALVSSARSGFLPVLGATAQKSRTGEDFFPQNGKWSAAVSLTFPLFGGGRDFFATRAAASTARSAAYLRADTDAELVPKLRQAWATYVEAVTRLEVDEKFLEAARTRAEIARQKYDNGLLSFEEWDRIESDLIRYEKNRLQSSRERVLAEAAWEQAQGRGVFE